MNTAGQCPKAAVIMVYYGDYAVKYFEACFRSLEQQSRVNARVEFFAVDNGASDESARLVRSLAPHYRHLDNGTNKGWASGNNLAIQTALSDGADYVILLNMDTVLDREWLKALIETANASAGTQIFQSKILLHGTNRINSIGNRTHFLGYGYCLGYGENDEPAMPREEADFASGASLLVKSEVFKRVGLFRDEFFMYYDDMEFCWRARLAGFRTGIAGDSRCYHKYNFSPKIDLLFYLERNRLLTLLTLEKKRTLAVILFALLLAQLVSATYFIMRGHLRAEWRLFLFFLKKKTWKYIRDKRREVCAIRCVRDAWIVKRFSGNIVFAEVRHPVFYWILNPLLRLYWKAAKQWIS